MQKIGNWGIVSCRLLSAHETEGLHITYSYLHTGCKQCLDFLEHGVLRPSMTYPIPNQNDIVG